MTRRPTTDPVTRCLCLFSVYGYDNDRSRVCVSAVTYWSDLERAVPARAPGSVRYLAPSTNNKPGNIKTTECIRSFYLFLVVKIKCTVRFRTSVCVF